jgi:hypothetical protein
MGLNRAIDSRSLRDHSWPLQAGACSNLAVVRTFVSGCPRPYLSRLWKDRAGTSKRMQRRWVCS